MAKEMAKLTGKAKKEVKKDNKNNMAQLPGKAKKEVKKDNQNNKVFGQSEEGSEEGQ